MGRLSRFAIATAVASAAVCWYTDSIGRAQAQDFLETVKGKVRDLGKNYFDALTLLNSQEDEKYYFWAQVFTVLLILYVIFFKRSYDPSKKGYGGRAPAPLSKAEQDALINEWQPDPLINLDIDTRLNDLGEELVLTTRLGPQVEIEGIAGEVLNLSGFDFLGMSLEESIHEKSKECLKVYGCGSCGPRGFYGTSDQHLALEVAIKDFFGTEEAIIYSDAACTMSSIIPAFAKRGDVVVADELVSESAISGIELSRSTARYFKHNDVGDLAKTLQSLTDSLKRKGKPLANIRRYVVVEGLYRNRGDFAPLREIIDCAKRFKFRIILDDSFAIGAVGKTGRGSLERAGIAATEVDFLAGSLATAFGSIGGFCTGSHVAVDHQRLAGAGYCFSASAPPFTCVAALEAISLIDSEPERLDRLRANLSLANQLSEELPGLKVVSEPDSPMLYLELADEDTPTDRDDRFRQEQRLQEIVDACLHGGAKGAAVSKSGRRSSRRMSRKKSGAGQPVLISRSRHVYPPAKSQRPALPNPSIRLSITSAHTEDDLTAAFATIAGALS